MKGRQTVFALSNFNVKNNLSQKFHRMIDLLKRTPLEFWGRRIKGQGHRGQCQIGFHSISYEPFIKASSDLTR